MPYMTNILNKIFKVCSLSMLVMVAFSSFFITTPALAQKLPGTSDLCPTNTGTSNRSGCRIIDPSQLTGQDALPKLATQISSFLAFIIASIAIIYIIYGAFIWMTAEKDGPERGRKMIFNAIIALVIAVVAFGVVQVIVNFLSSGFSITQ
jgi:hypothetical protein